MLYTCFFYKQQFIISNTRLKFAKNEANANEHPEAEHLKIIRILYPRYQPRIGHIFKNKQKKQVRPFARDYMINHNENKDDNEDDNEHQNEDENEKEITQIQNK